MLPSRPSENRIAANCDFAIAIKVAVAYEVAKRKGTAENAAMIAAVSAYQRLMPSSTNLDACQMVLDIIEGWTKHLTQKERNEMLDLDAAQSRHMTH